MNSVATWGSTRCMMIPSRGVGMMSLLAATEFSQVALAHFIVLSAILFTIGLIGFLTRRNLIVMFLCTELMFQAAAIAFVAFGRYWFDFTGQSS